MKSALKKSVVSTSISLILASGMAAFAAHAADDVKLKATKTNVAFSDFTPTEYSTKGKPNIIVLTMDDLGYGQLPFDKGSFDPKTMENREVVDTYKIGIDKAGNDSNLLIVFYVQIMPDDFVMQLHRF